MAENTTELTSYEWKLSLSARPLKTHNVLVSLYDLLYDEEGELWINNDTLSKAGTRLSHDIICFNSNLNKTSGELNLNSGPLSESPIWWTNGIDISLVQYDPRARAKKVVNTKTFQGKQLFTNGTYTIYDKDAAIAPSNLAQFCAGGVRRNQHSLAQDPTLQNYKPPKILPITSDSSSIDSDILLSSEDIVFKGTLVSSANYYAYNSIFVNPNSTFGKFLIARAIGINPEIICKDLTTENRGLYNEFQATNSHFQLTSGTSDTESDSIADAIGRAEYFYILKNTFVWVRAPFYADYIKPESFNQDLTPNSKVVHNELMLSGTADFNRYDRYLKQLSNEVNTDDQNTANTPIGPEDSEPEERSETSDFYIPVTSPTVDFFTNDFLESFLPSIKKDSVGYSSKLETWDAETDKYIDTFIQESVDGNNSVVKAIPIAPINRGDITKTSPDNLVPPGWFDPESRKGDDYYLHMGKFPSILPKDGNLYVGGRIISATIDEIWYMLKKLVGGRDKDTVIASNDIDIAQPYNTDYQNPTDTRMTEVPDSEFIFKPDSSMSTEVKGDPIDIEYDRTNKNNIVVKVSKFVNQNNAIKYPIFKSLQAISNTITSLNEQDIRGINYFSAWSKNSVDNNRSSDTILTDNPIISGEWAPRETPLSLRELEALIMGEKYNLITEARFVMETFGVTGKFGKVVSNTYNSAAGSLYQFHKDYNFHVDTPNTWFNQNGNGTPESGTSIVLDDPTETPVGLENLVGKNTSVKKFAANYGSNENFVEDPEKVSASDVYLAADGTWRYVFDQVRVPVLKSRF